MRYKQKLKQSAWPWPTPCHHLNSPQPGNLSTKLVSVIFQPPLLNIGSDILLKPLFCVTEAYFSKPVQIYNIGKEVVGTLKYPSEKIICKKKFRSQTDLYYFLRVKKTTIDHIHFPWLENGMSYGLHLSHDLTGYYHALIHHIYFKNHSDLFRD